MTAPARATADGGELVGEETQHGVTIYYPTATCPYYRLSWRDGLGRRRQASAGRDYEKALRKAATIDARLAAESGDLCEQPPAALLAAYLDPKRTAGRRGERAWSPKHAAGQKYLSRRF